MDTDFLHEQAYLKQTRALIERSLTELLSTMDEEREKLAQARQELQENQPAFAGDMDKQAETAQYLNGLQTQLSAYRVYAERLKKLQGLQDSPYFGRIDFAEEGQDADTYYIGRSSLRDPLTFQIQVCDWRTPLASMFYRSSPGPASFMAPQGSIAGRLLLKRQYEISKGELLYYFDTESHIKDNILKKLLGQKASPQMKAIVESLQEAQDRLIREKSRNVLLVQGAAGSGKTSLALHRAAFLMYQDFQDALSSREILVISPNHLFSHYIRRVLPELGEDNITSLTFEDIFTLNLDRLDTVPEGQTRIPDMESLLGESRRSVFSLRQGIYAFKNSAAFAALLSRLADYYGRRLIELPDIYYHHTYIASRQELKEELLRDRVGLPLAKRLEQIRRRLSLKIHQLKKQRLPSLQLFVSEYPDHQLEIFPFARLLSMKRGAYLNRVLDRLTAIDIPGLYRRLWDKELFYHLAKGLDLPANIEDIRQACFNALTEAGFDQSDAAGLIWLRLILEGTADYPQIRQVMVDEAQDYGPLHYMLLKKWFPKANFTVLGDIQQSLIQPHRLDHYQEIGKALGDPDCPTAILRESYRSSWEISSFCRRFLEYPDLLEPFQRHSKPVEIFGAANNQEAIQLLLDTINRFRKEDVGSIAVICKTAAQAAALYSQIKGKSALQLVKDAGKADLNRSLLLPLHLVKGLEFDGVILWDVSEENYGWPEQKRFLYLAASRALHRLTLLFIGQLSPLVQEDSEPIAE